MHRSKAPRHLPGEEGIWMFVAGDLVIFALFFVTYLYYRGQDIALFDRSQRLLNGELGVLNTLLLLTSSWLVAMAVAAVRADKGPRARLLLLGSLGCGIGFVLVKIVEYHAKISAGVTLVTNDFFMFYFMLTGIHLVHLFIGLAVLTLLSRQAVTSGPAQLRTFENGATFWHMVDLLWIILFALLYVVAG